MDHARLIRSGHPPGLHSFQFPEFLGDEYTLLVGAAKIAFKVHTNVMAASKVFHRMSQSSFQETHTKVVELKEIRASTTISLLSYLYSRESHFYPWLDSKAQTEREQLWVPQYLQTGEWTISLDILSDLYILADMYELQGLREDIVELLWSQRAGCVIGSFDTGIDFFHFADRILSNTAAVSDCPFRARFLSSCHSIAWALPGHDREEFKQLMDGNPELGRLCFQAAFGYGKQWSYAYHMLWSRFCRLGHGMYGKAQTKYQDAIEATTLTPLACLDSTHTQYFSELGNMAEEFEDRVRDLMYELSTPTEALKRAEEGLAYEEQSHSHTQKRMEMLSEQLQATTARAEYAEGHLQAERLRHQGNRVRMTLALNRANQAARSNR
ncbi:hypothetical protein MMC25_004191 [Agyrium rufum]|nr:hypothetical protein [Agyrium rufum]